MKKKAIELKSCPFCGSKCDMITNDGRRVGAKEKFHPCCHNEKCILFVGGMWYDTEKEAADAWNTRTV